MSDTSVNFTPPPEALMTDERLAEIVWILVTAVGRANPPELNENFPLDGDSLLGILALQHRRLRQMCKRVGSDA